MHWLLPGINASVIQISRISIVQFIFCNVLHEIVFQENVLLILNEGTF